VPCVSSIGNSVRDCGKDSVLVVEASIWRVGLNFSGTRVHPMLIVFPLDLFATEVAFDVDMKLILFS